MSDFRTWTPCTNCSRNVKNVIIISARKNFNIVCSTRIFILGIEEGSEKAPEGGGFCQEPFLSNRGEASYGVGVKSLSAHTWIPGIALPGFPLCPWGAASGHIPRVAFTQTCSNPPFHRALKMWGHAGDALGSAQSCWCLPWAVPAGRQGCGAGAWGGWGWTCSDGTSHPSGGEGGALQLSGHSLSLSLLFPKPSKSRSASLRP